MVTSPTPICCMVGNEKSLGKSSAPGSCPGIATWRNTDLEKFLTFWHSPHLDRMSTMLSSFKKFTQFWIDDTRLGNFPYSTHLVCCTNIMNSDKDRPILQFFLVSLESLFACSITSLQWLYVDHMCVEHNWSDTLEIYICHMENANVFISWKL